MTERQAAILYFARLSSPVRGGLLMIGAGASFAVMMALVRHLSQDMHPFETAFFRNLFGVVFILPWAFWAGWSRLKTGRMRMHLIRSLTGLASMLCLFSALSLMPLAEATALTYTSPLFATAGAALFLHEKVRLRRWMATAIGFIGTLIIIRPGTEAMNPAALVALASAVFMAAAMLSVKSLSRTEHPNAVVLIMGLLMTPMSLAPALFVWMPPPPHTWIWLVIMGLAATVGQVLLTRAFVAADASAVLPFDFARLIFVSILGYLLFSERPDTWTWVGAAIIVAATVYIAHREAKLGADAIRPRTLTH